MVRDPKRILKILKKLSYLMEENNMSIMEAVYEGVKGDPDDPYYYEDQDWLRQTEEIPTGELNKEAHFLLSTWEDLADLRLTQLVCNPLQLEANKGEIYSKHPREYTDEELLKLFREYY